MMDWRIATGIVLVIAAIGTVACTEGQVGVRHGGAVVSEITIEDALKQHTEKLMSLPGVVGTAQGLCDGKPCIKVYVVKKTSELERKIPDAIDGYSVEIVETGDIKALPEEQY